MDRHSSRPVFVKNEKPDGLCFECDPAAMSFVGRYARELWRVLPKSRTPVVLSIRKTYDHADNFELSFERQNGKVPNNPLKLLFLPAFALPDKEIIGKYAAFTAFDPEFVSKSELAALKNPEHLFVPSIRHAEFLHKMGILGNKVSVLKPTADRSIYNPAAGWPDKLLRKNKNFTFLAVLSPLRRHGIDLLLRAWVEEFKPEDSVRLILKFSHIPRLKKKLSCEISDLAMRLGALNEMFAPVKILEGPLSESDLAGLMAGSDVMLCPDRLSWAGCRKAEALSCGLPVIAPSEIDENVGYVLSRCRVKQKSDSLYPGSKCAEVLEPEVDSLRRRMREAFQNTDDLKRRRDACLLKAEKLNTWSETASILTDIFSKNYGFCF